MTTFTAETNAKKVESQEVKIRKGQAFNLAVAQAIHEGKAEDRKYIYQQYLKFYDMASLLQSTDIQDLKTVLED
jgi:hypothetical protein